MGDLSASPSITGERASSSLTFTSAGRTAPAAKAEKLDLPSFKASPNLEDPKSSVGSNMPDKREEKK